MIFIFSLLVPDYTKDGEACKTKCGHESLYNGKNWCYTVSGTPEWDYCCPNKRVEHVPGYIFDQKGAPTPGITYSSTYISDSLWKYIKLNTIDLMVVRGKSASKRNMIINNRHQESVGFGNEMVYITNP